MKLNLITRRQIAGQLAVLPAILGAGTQVFAAQEMSAATGAPDGLTRESESIHQEVALRAPPRVVYDALTTSEAFDAVTRLSDGLALVTAPGAKPTAISRSIGGSFTLFGGYITGLNLEMLPGERLVQAWRTQSWAPAAFSVVSFALAATPSGTIVSFDHRGFPDGQGSHLAPGWHEHYWTPMAKYLQKS